MFLLPQIEKRVKDEILLWEKDRGQTFLVNGMFFINYIKKTWQDHEEDKRREKEDRVSKAVDLNDQTWLICKPFTAFRQIFGFSAKIKFNLRPLLLGIDT
ncbi:hypothetical protein DPMN_058418 [Dreissena polymorpha]|uniref:Uncharacterized protein n=1 Tax=Dreissena polymorpha TaxID=45954 RepID=A0A9D4C1Q1_DREPO|nr:hypothetical protein DPMN_058418 [Dreissena polymorpha]